MAFKGHGLGQVNLRLKDFLFVLKRDIPIALMMGIAIAVFECVLAVVSKVVGTNILLTVRLSII